MSQFYMDRIGQTIYDSLANDFKIGGLFLVVGTTAYIVNSTAQSIFKTKKDSPSSEVLSLCAFGASVAAGLSFSNIYPLTTFSPGQVLELAICSIFIPLLPLVGGLAGLFPRVSVVATIVLAGGLGAAVPSR